MSHTACRLTIATLGICCAQLATSATAETAGLNQAISQLRAASAEGGSQLAQQQAWNLVASADVSELPQVLAALEDAGQLAQNWLRTAADAIAERTLAEVGSLPADLLEEFATDRSQPPRGRRVAYEWLLRVDPQAEQRLLPQMLDDSSLELRFDAVAQLVATAEASQDHADNEEAEQRALLEKALAHARDVKQIESIAKSLEALGKAPDLIEQMGYLVDWQIIGPFDNTDLAGFETRYPPETDADLTAIHQGKPHQGKNVEGKSGEVRWQPFHSDHKQGVVDFNKPLGAEKEVIAYAAAIIDSAKPQEVDLRLSTQNAAKVWLNGELVGAYEVYHSGFAIDQFVMPVELKAGENRVLVKICQNAKKMGWQKQWEFRLRVTDKLGGAANVKAVVKKASE